MKEGEAFQVRGRRLKGRGFVFTRNKCCRASRDVIEYRVGLPFADNIMAIVPILLIDASGQDTTEDEDDGA